MTESLNNNIINTILPIQFEPKRNNRFIVLFDKSINLPSWSVQKINKPKFTNNEWDNIKIDFIDPIGPSTSSKLFELCKTKNKDFTFEIISLDPTGVEIEKWLIVVENILTINFGDLDYSDDDIQKPYIVIKPSSCNLIF